ncbi:hypothetical protein [Actinacidiphila glaucinigra]|uniref:hypothetical protein n=1 Tax=Actinacidiphila glaucinigra TaxID=235986 RepID=UPI002E2F2720|nr:hypothetical protein [Actinacidiphila glaucinigra]
MNNPSYTHIACEPTRPGDEPRAAYYPPSLGYDRFKILRLLARAGQGYTLLAEDRWSGAPVVIKGMWWPQTVLDRPEFAQEELDDRAGDRERGLRAARQASQLTQQCPVVVDVLEEPSPSLAAVGAPDVLSERFVVQQFIGYRTTGARTLQDVIEERADSRRPFSESELLDLADQLCNTLAALHTPRRTADGKTSIWIHADVKPENILVLGPPWRYVLIDYDAAVARDKLISTTTTAYAPPGPPAANGEDQAGETDHASDKFDIYMMGATLAHAAALRRLTLGQRQALYSENQDDYLEAKRRLADLGYGPILTSVIATCLAAPKFRLSDVGVVRIDLGRARASGALLAALAGT